MSDVEALPIEISVVLGDKGYIISYAVEIGVEQPEMDLGSDPGGREDEAGRNDGGTDSGERDSHASKKLRGNVGNSGGMGEKAGSGDMQEDLEEAGNGVEEIQLEALTTEIREIESAGKQVEEYRRMESRPAGQALPADRVTESVGLRRSRRLNGLVEGSGLGADEDILQKAMRMTATRNLD